jgi:hypothetical protein
LLGIGRAEGNNYRTSCYSREHTSVLHQDHGFLLD